MTAASASASPSTAKTQVEDALHLSTPSVFAAFPYSPPYSIQVSLMQHLYASIEDRKIAIIESPTGTGKTLSLLCASLTWLADDKDRARKGKLASASASAAASKEPEWVFSQTLDRLKREMEAADEEHEERLREARRREAESMRKAKAQVRYHKKLRPSANINPASQDSDDEEEYLPDMSRIKIGEDEYDNLSPEVRELMKKLDKSRKGSSYANGDDADELDHCTKVYYASRTHSQLSQVLPEMKRLKLVPLPALASTPSASFSLGHKRAFDDACEDGGSAESYSRLVSLGSRKQLCINEDVRKKKDMDEGCRALLEAKDSNKRCPYLPPVDEEFRMTEFRDQILASPKDIEDLAESGRVSGICPYFGSRRAIPQAEVITLPYNLLLQKSAREALGINLKDQVVIIDEAHNLISILLSLSTTKLSSTTISITLGQLNAYLERFRARLSAIHALHLKRLLVFLDALTIYLDTWGAGGSALHQDKASSSKETSATPAKPYPGLAPKAEVITIATLLERLGKKAAAINLLEIEKYLRSSKIAHKIAGYSEKQSEKDGKNSAKRNAGATPPLYDVEAFIIALSGKTDDSRITISAAFPSAGPDSQPAVEIKFQLLNPAPHFADVVADARSVILAGGTMSPMSDIVNQLFTELPSSKISTFSCGHIIPPESLQTLVIPKGLKSSVELEYTAAKQKDPSVIAELGQILFNFASCIHYGMIVFFPSYNFLNAAKAVWVKSQLLERLQGKKKVFFEPEDGTRCERVLQEYATEISNPSTSRGPKAGALLFAVIGAKLSEGLNFTDNLARAVVIIGLPFANLGSPELKERLRYVKKMADERKAIRKPGEQDAAAELYENMCMNAVNQSIGRAIRHKGDWSSLILLDRRYSQPRIQKKLPKWIGDRVTVVDNFGQAIKALGTFYRAKA